MSNRADISPDVNQAGSDLQGKVAVVTGGSRGIGKAIALELARQGASVAICSRNRQQLEATAVELSRASSNHFASTCNVSNETEVSEFIGRVQNSLGNIDILVNNAGLYKTEPVQTHSTTVWEEVLQTNLTGAMLFCRAVLNGMIERGWGRIINISSISGRVGEIWGSAYSASKFGMIGLTQSLALEVARNGITVNAVCPGWVSTEMSTEQLSDPQWCNLTGTSATEAVSNACLAIPQNRMIEPGEVAALVAFLASNSARGITGQSINICGGLSLQ